MDSFNASGFCVWDLMSRDKMRGGKNGGEEEKQSPAKSACPPKGRRVNGGQAAGAPSQEAPADLRFAPTSEAGKQMTKIRLGLRGGVCGV